MQKIFFLLAFFLFSLQLQSQNLPEGFERAKVLLNSQSYTEAIQAFQEFLNPEEYGNLSRYAAFYSASAALELNQIDRAIGWLQPLASQSWSNQNQSKYLLAKAYFQNEQRTEALRIAMDLQSTDLNESMQDMVYDFLIQSSTTFLTQNIREFQDLPAYRAALSNVLSQKNILSSDERSLFYEMQGMGIEGISQGKKNDVLDIVVILPFTDAKDPRFGKLDPGSFTYELFQGIRFGVRQLVKEGKKVNLVSFDSKRDLAHLRNILKDPAIANADLIIGPIYPDEADLVSAFAENAKIPFVHPLSNLGDRFSDRAFSYLFRPSVEDLANGIVSNLKARNWGNRVALGFSNSSRDEQLSQFLEAKLAAEGFNLIQKSSLNPRNASSFLNDLRILPSRDSAKVLVDQVILLSDDPAIAQPTLSYIESVTAEVPILVMDSWLGFNFANYEMLEFPNFYFISNNSPHFGTEEMEVYRRAFYDRYLVFPSVNSVLGTELIYWLDSFSSASSGWELRENLKQKDFLPGRLTWGFDYKDSNSNQYVPVFGLEAGELKPIN